MSNESSFSFGITLGVLVTAFLMYIPFAEEKRRADKLERELDSAKNIQDSIQSVLERDKQEPPIASEGGGKDSLSHRKSVLWMTRAVLSETTRDSEMLYVANVIRNRLDLQYRGKTSVKGVVLDQKQFSAFNSNTPRRQMFINLTRDDWLNGPWDRAWQISRFVLTAPRGALPLRNPCITHFYYPGVLNYRPGWVDRMEPVHLGDVELPRVIFFKQDRSEICR